MTLFAKIAEGKLPASIVHRDDLCIAFMDIHPMSPGHVLVCPLQAVATLDELPPDTLRHLWSVAQRIAQAQRRGLGSLAQHFLVNDGQAASQTVPHVHIHVIPRYRGDRWRSLARIIAHIAVLAVPPPVSRRKRSILDEQAKNIAQALADLSDGRAATQTGALSSGASS